MCINVDFKQQQRNLIPLETDFPQGNCHHVPGIPSSWKVNPVLLVKLTQQELFRLHSLLVLTHGDSWTRRLLQEEKQLQNLQTQSGFISSTTQTDSGLTGSPTDSDDLIDSIHHSGLRTRQKHNGLHRFNHVGSLTRVTRSSETSAGSDDSSELVRLFRLADSPEALLTQSIRFTYLDPTDCLCWLWRPSVKGCIRRCSGFYHKVWNLWIKVWFT